MNELTLQWHSEALWQQLEPLLPGLSVEVVASVSSTNTALLDRARVGNGLEVDSGNVIIRRSLESAAFGRRAADVQPSLLVTEHQPGGRGRQGRSWVSAPGASLTFSIGLPLAVSDWSGLSLAVGVALAEAIGGAQDPTGVAGATGNDIAGDAESAARRVEEPVVAATAIPVGDPEPRPRLGLKWPNDLLLMEGMRGGRKLGGVLIETVAAGRLRFVVVGIGLNVLPFRAGDVTTGFASASELDPDVSAPQLLRRVALPLVQALRQFEEQGFAAFADRYAALDVLRGRMVRTVQGVPMEGRAAGVDARGALLVETGDGLQAISSGEVSIRFDTDTDRDAVTAPGAMC